MIKTYQRNPVDLIKDLAQLSKYRPEGGDALKLFRLVVEQALPQEEIISYFHSPTTYRQTKKRLKDKLLDGILLNSFSHLTKVQQQHFKVRKHSLEILMLIQSGKKLSAITIAEETLAMAEKLGLIDVALGLSRELAYHYAGVEVNTPKHLKYSEKNTSLKRKFDEEWEIQRLYSSMAYCVQKRLPADKVLEQLELIAPIVSENKEYKFRLFYYSLLILVAKYNSDQKEVIRVCKAASAFFDSSEHILPYTTKWNFNFQMIPVYITQREYANAKGTIEDCLTLPSAGSYNWHLTLLYKAILGFYSSNYDLVSAAWKQAHSHAKKFKSAAIDHKWKVIRAYLSLLDQLNLVTFTASIKVNRCISLMQPNIDSKPDLIILELLYLLLNNKKKDYLAKAKNIDSYIDHQKSKIPSRARHFLRMLKCVQTANFHPVRTKAHARKHLVHLKRVSVAIDISVLDGEVLPFEGVWGLVMEILREKK